MKVILSGMGDAGDGAHGGSVIAHRHALMLRRAGAEVFAIRPRDPAPMRPGEEASLCYEWGAAGALLAEQRPNASAARPLQSLLRDLAPDVVYDVHGPTWPLAAAVDLGIPAVSMIGDYRWFCQRTFLVDGRLRRCSGPETLEKCYTCLQTGASWKRKALQTACRAPGIGGMAGALAARLGFAPGDLRRALGESRRCLEQLRPRVSRYVIGDRQAFEFFAGHGIPEHRIARIPQALPDDARAQRPRDPALPVKERPLRIGFVGRLDPDKGFRVLARAFERLPDPAPAELRVIHRTAANAADVAAQFTDRGRFHALLERGRIKLFRPDSPDELFRLMAQLDVGVVPSIQYEAPCLALLEMVAQKTPIVRAESAGMEHVIQDGVNGRTFPYGDSAALAEILARILDRPELLAAWRSRLPEIGSDQEYARQLLAVFDAAADARQTGA